MPFTDAADNWILTCLSYDLDLSDLETWFSHIFSYFSSKQASDIILWKHLKRLDKKVGEFRI
jgi:hypothetical protein